MADGQTRGVDWRVVVVFWALTAAAFAARALLTGATAPLINDTDDAMRLVEVRDFIGGQGWFDLHQYRLNTPLDAPSLHWSRLVDLPLAALLLALKPVFGAGAETVLAYVWPTLLLFGLFALSARIAVRLAGPEGLLPGVALPALSLITMSEFAPGRLDHHGLQILLAMAMVDHLMVALKRPGRAWVAGALAALAIAIGAESLPTAIAGIGAVGLVYIHDKRHAGAMARFGGGLGGATSALLVLGVAPADWSMTICDAISPAFAVGALLAAAGLVLLSRLTLSRWPQRLAAGLVLGGAVGIAMLFLFPGCFAGPYASLGPWLLTHWIDRIDEAKPLWVSIGTDAPYVLAVGVPVLFALIVSAAGLRTQARERWLVYGAVLLVAAVVMLSQIRGARLAVTLAAPAGAVAIAWARERFLVRRTPTRLGALLVSWVGFAGLLLGLGASLVDVALSGNAQSPGATQAERASCRLPGAFTTLAALQPTRIMAPVDLGAHLLLYTPHSVVGAPYHRNVEGVTDTYAFFNAPIAEARAIIERRGIGLVVLCPAMPEVEGLADAAEDSFARLRGRQDLPDWLVPNSPPGAVLETYTVALR